MKRRLLLATPALLTLTRPANAGWHSVLQRSIPAAGGGGYAFLVKSTVFGNAPTTPAIDTTGANLIVVCTAAYAGAATLTDSKSNTWLKATTDKAVGVVVVSSYYCYAPTVGSGHTFHTTGPYDFIAVAAFSGAATSPLDQVTSATGGAAITTIQAGSITPTQANELVVAWLGIDGGSTLPTIGSSYTVTDSLNQSGSNEGGGLAYLIQTSAAATNPAWSWTGGCSAAAVIASFK